MNHEPHQYQSTQAKRCQVAAQWIKSDYVRQKATERLGIRREVHVITIVVRSLECYVPKTPRPPPSRPPPFIPAMHMNHLIFGDSLRGKVCNCPYTSTWFSIVRRSKISTMYLGPAIASSSRQSLSTTDSSLVSWGSEWTCS